MTNKTKKLKIVIFTISLVICVLATIYLFPIIIKLTNAEGRLEFREKIANLGPLGVLMLFGLEFAQMFLFILPGEPIEILAGMCYGYIFGTLFIMLSSLLISTFIFFLVKKVGKDFVYEFCSKEKVNKIENSKVFKNTKRIEIIMIILFLIPGTPKDFLVFVAGLVPINPIRFLLMSTVARFPSVISSTIAGASLVNGNLKAAIISYVVTFLIISIGIIILNKLDKNKLTKSAIESIK